MQYQKIINFLDDTPNQTSKFQTKYWVEKVMIHVERITPKVKINSKLQC